MWGTATESLRKGVLLPRIVGIAWLLDTTVQQTAAHTIYRKRGFSETGRTVIGGVNCILFEKDLSTEVAAGGPTEVDPET